jgi:hypothetical protein
MSANVIRLSLFLLGGTRRHWWAEAGTATTIPAVNAA